MYDPFAPGPFSVGERSFEALDRTRRRMFPCHVWHPVEAGDYPLIIFSHHSGGNRRSSTFLCRHLCGHGYVVAALDHSEMIAPELARKEGMSLEERNARMEAIVASRVPDVHFLMDHLLNEWDAEARIDPAAIGIVGHSFGGWTALAAPAADPRLGAVVALAPGGSSNPKPGIIRAKLDFRWGREVPTLILAAENDTPLPLEGMFDIFERAPEPKRMAILRRADHLHFVDDVEQRHEESRLAPLTGQEWDWIAKEMLPMAELCSGDQAHLFIRGLTVCHMDAALKRREEARRFFAGGIEAELASRGVDAIMQGP
ncbi:MAG TPA: dienelactone hydrolase family protein [Bryobacteraceae bacterium]